MEWLMNTFGFKSIGIQWDKTGYVKCWICSQVGEACE